MFSYSNYEPLQSKTQVMVDDSEWSKPLSFEAVGSAFAVSVPKEKLGNPGEVLLGVDVAEGTGKYYLTKVVTFSPRFLVRNMLNEDLYFQQAGTVQMNLLASNCTTSLIHMRRFPDVVPHLCIRLANSNSLWSNPFQLTDIPSVYVKVGRNDSITEDLIRVDIALEKATIFISFYRQENRWPIRIDNLTEFDMSIHQDKARKMYLIPSNESLQYQVLLT
jgi:vacuolar protein sorting-associated protein 13A/C